MPEVKCCVLFAVDNTTTEVLEDISGELLERFPRLFVPRGANNLPYHMTMIGGIRLSADAVEGTLRELLSCLQPFQENGPVPRVKELEPLQLNGNVLAVRLKLAPRTYVLTGDPARNKELVRKLNPRFELDDIRHISLGSIRGGLEEMNTVLPAFGELVQARKASLGEMRLVSQIWIKERGTNTWTRRV